MRRSRIKARGLAAGIAAGPWLAACAAPAPLTQTAPVETPREQDAGADVLKLGVSVDRVYPHARDAFTEGLVFTDTWLYESTGLEGASTLRRLRADTGEIDTIVRLDPELFGEGLALVDGRLIQLTWREGRALVYDQETLTLQGEFRYQGEGWGLCYDGRHLIMSNGSSELMIRDPQTFELLERLQVRLQGKPLEQLNELECAANHIFANVWYDRHIARIDPASGQVTAWIDTSALLSYPDAGDFRGADVLNGIAYRPDRDRFLLTGKYWPRIFEVELVER